MPTNQDQVRSHWGTPNQQDKIERIITGQSGTPLLHLEFDAVELHRLANSLSAGECVTVTAFGPRVRAVLFDALAGEVEQ